MAIIRSMTGFGSARAASPAGEAAVDIKSVNYRGLKITVKSRLPIGVLEKRVRDRVGAACARGAVDVCLSLTRPAGAVKTGTALEALRERASAIRAVAAELGLPGDLKAGDLAGLYRDWEEACGVDPVSEEEWPLLSSALDDALLALDAMRRAEGENMAAALRRHMDPVVEFSAAARLAAPDILRRMRQRIVRRLDEWLPASPVDRAALEREAAQTAEKADIAEELDRLDSHLAQFRAILDAGRDTGRRLEFLSQEMLREVNTAMAKAADPPIAALAVSAKLAIEQIREQAANVE